MQQIVDCVNSAAVPRGIAMFFTYGLVSGAALGSCPDISR
jgi:hypothetical protein